METVHVHICSLRVCTPLHLCVWLNPLKNSNSHRHLLPPFFWDRLKFSHEKRGERWDIHICLKYMGAGPEFRILTGQPRLDSSVRLGVRPVPVEEKPVWAPEQFFRDEDVLVLLLFQSSSESRNEHTFISLHLSNIELVEVWHFKANYFATCTKKCLWVILLLCPLLPPAQRTPTTLWTPPQSPPSAPKCLSWRASQWDISPISTRSPSILPSTMRCSSPWAQCCQCQCRARTPGPWMRPTRKWM